MPKSLPEGVSPNHVIDPPEGSPPGLVWWRDPRRINPRGFWFTGKLGGYRRMIRSTTLDAGVEMAKRMAGGDA